MAVVTRILAAAALMLGASGARLQKGKGRNGKGARGSEVIQGVPVLSSSSSGARSLGAQKWNIVFDKNAVATKVLKKFCENPESSMLQGICRLIGSPSEGGFGFLTVDAPKKWLGTLLKAILSKVGKVKYVEEDAEAEAFTELGAQGLNRPWGLNRVGVPESSAKGKGVNVYVLDTGVRTSHNDFEGRAASAIDLSTGAVVECSGDGDCARDGQGHGTHCAGTVGGKRHGVAPEANIFAGKVLSDSGRGEFSWSFAALDWVSTMGGRPAVASMSLGGKGVLQAMSDSVDASVAAGVVVVVASGNSNDDACGYSPAFAPAAVTVGSTNLLGRRSVFSNYGKCVDIWAPGSNIISCSHRSNWGFKSLSGTSMACPHVSGAVALAFEKSPDSTPDEVLQTLLDNAKKDDISGLKTEDTNAFLWVGDL